MVIKISEKVKPVCTVIYLMKSVNTLSANSVSSDSLSYLLKLLRGLKLRRYAFVLLLFLCQYNWVSFDNFGILFNFFGF